MVGTIEINSNTFKYSRGSRGEFRLILGKEDSAKLIVYCSLVETLSVDGKKASFDDVVIQMSTDFYESVSIFSLFFEGLTYE